MAMPHRRRVGYAFLAAGVSLLFDTYTFLRTGWSPLRIPLDASSELALGYVLPVVGIATLLWPTIMELVGDTAPDASMKLGQSLASHSVEWRRQLRLPLKKRFVMLPNRGLVGGSAVLFLLLPMYLMLEQPASRGIYVGINTWTGQVPDSSCLAGPIIVSVRQDGAAAQLFLNGSEIKPKDLARALRSQLATRANWEVFVEGDDSLSYSEAIDVIDQIRALHAKSVMLTPKLKKELAEKCSWR